MEQRLVQESSMPHFHRMLFWHLFEFIALLFVLSLISLISFPQNLMHSLKSLLQLAFSHVFYYRYSFVHWSQSHQGALGEMGHHHHLRCALLTAHSRRNDSRLWGPPEDRRAPHRVLDGREVHSDHHAVLPPRRRNSHAKCSAKETSCSKTQGTAEPRRRYMYPSFYFLSSAFLAKLFVLYTFVCLFVCYFYWQTNLQWFC